MNIKLLKLVTGENVITDVEYDGDAVTLKNPLQVAMVPSRSGAPNFALLPYLLTDDTQVTIMENKVMFTVDPMDEFLEQYNGIFGNIVTPPKSIIY